MFVGVVYGFEAFAPGPTLTLNSALGLLTVVWVVLMVVGAACGVVAAVTGWPMLEYLGLTGIVTSMTVLSGAYLVTGVRGDNTGHILIGVFALSFAAYKAARLVEVVQEQRAFRMLREEDAHGGHRDRWE